ncbi:MAG: threonine--tRNA ligase [Candidatus Altiarchaeales archaeon]|nr:MAG: threonine--tRNA ligase [Candidatus Altiarchaeales archaeon]
MRVLLIHSDYIKFKAKKKAIKAAEKIEKPYGELENVLIAFIAVEKVDEKNPDSVVKQLIAELRKTVKKVDAESIALYPYAHLSSSLGSSSTARKILDKAYEELKDEFKTIKAPFGWYKSFELRCKGHPLSELSRTILPEGEEEVSEALKAEKRLKSHWYILDLDGRLIPVEKFNFKGHENLKKFADYEISKVRAVKEEPPHVKLMRSHELVDYEPGSDPGNLRWYPKGYLIKNLLEEHVSNIVAENGGMRVETPIMYSCDHPQLSRYLDRFPARQYTLKAGGREYFLRFAACFGQYLIKHDMTISYKNLPLKLYELSHYSFRYEQSGELVGLRRLRAFTMPDMHTLVRDMTQAKEEFLNQYGLSLRWMEDLGLDYEVGIRFVREFYEENREFAHELIKLVKKPALIEIWDERPFYFVMKFEFNFVDALNKASALSTVQIDIENTERFGITYVDEDGKEKHPLMLHASISGSIDRNVYALLENAYLEQQRGNKPMLPLWLSPTQVRLVPVSEEFNEFAQEIADELDKNRIRVDIDDRNETIGKKIREAEREWIPYILVLGEREKKSQKFKVRIRRSGEQRDMSLKELIREIKDKTGNLPFKPLPLSRFVSERPRFV